MVLKDIYPLLPLILITTWSSLSGNPHRNRKNAIFIYGKGHTQRMATRNRRRNRKNKRAQQIVFTGSCSLALIDLKDDFFLVVKHCGIFLFLFHRNSSVPRNHNTHDISMS